jgi:hypothetical protein
MAKYFSDTNGNNSGVAVNGTSAIIHTEKN